MPREDDDDGYDSDTCCDNLELSFLWGGEIVPKPVFCNLFILSLEFFVIDDEARSAGGRAALVGRIFLENNGGSQILFQKYPIVTSKG